MENSKFQGVKMKINEKHNIKKEQFLQALFDNLSQRLNTTIASRVVDDAAVSDFALLLDQIDTLNPLKWPTSVKVPWYDGESKLRKFVKRFGLGWEETLPEFREYVRSKGKSVPNRIIEIKRVINAIPVTSADCERGFSAMNLIMTSSRNRLTIAHTSNLMFVKLVGPPISQFDPVPYVTQWLRTHRSATDTRIKIASAPKHSEQYNFLWNIF